MAPAKLVNLARVATATVGTGTLTLGAAISGYLTFAQAGVVNGDIVSYGIADGANSEVGTGLYTAAGTTLTRNVTNSTNANAAIALSGNAQVFVAIRSEDYVARGGDTMTGRLILPVGSVGAPSYSFTSDLTSGLYRSGVNQLSISTAGTEVMRWGSDGSTRPQGALMLLADPVFALQAATKQYVDLREPAIALGTTAQYWRGDKTWQTLPGGGAPSGPAGGVLNGTYPNPGLADNSVYTSNIVDGAVTGFKIFTNSVSNTQLYDMPAGTVKGRALGGGTGDPQDLTQAQLAALVAPSTSYSYRNILSRNGGFEVWQRGAGGSASFGITAGVPIYIADGWYISTTAAYSVIQQSATVTNGSRYSMSVTRMLNETGVGQNTIEFPLDTDEIALARGNVVTLSMSLAALANWSPAGGNISISLYIGTGNPARRTSGAYTGETVPINVVQPITGSLTRYGGFTSASAIPVTTKQASVLVQWTPVGTAGFNDGFYIDDVQLEVGPVATPFERRPFEQELLACRRHYWKSFLYGDAPLSGQLGVNGVYSFQLMRAGALGVATPTVTYPVQMRSLGTITTFNPWVTNAQIRNYTKNADFTGTAVGFNNEWGTSFSGTAPATAAIGDTCFMAFTVDSGI